MVVGAVTAAVKAVPSGGVLRGAKISPRRKSVMQCEAKSNAPVPPQLSPEEQAQMEKAMQDPEVQKRMASMEEAMKDPAMQQQMAEAQAAMSNPALQQRMSELKDDPEFKQMFQDIQTGGMPALMKYFNDPKVLAKLGSKLEDVPMDQGAAPAAPQVNDLFDAARYGDLEAVEDFLAVGKDVNMQDVEGRTPLHYAAAHDNTRIAQALIDNKADLGKLDIKNNSALHYACGYGRLDLVDILLRGGADVRVENENGKKPLALAELNPENPVLADKEIVSQLSA